MEEDRGSIWSVPPGTAKIYFGVFAVSLSLGTIYAATVSQTLEEAIRTASSAAILGACWSMVSVEVYRMIADIIRKERETRAREEGRKESYKKWESWYEKEKLKGTRFTSPPPDLEQEKKRR